MIYLQNLPFYLSFIDDLFRIWVPLSGNSKEDGEVNWAAFKADTIINHRLEWTFTEQVTTASFMDLTIRIVGNDKKYDLQKNLCT